MFYFNYQHAFTNKWNFSVKFKSLITGSRFKSTLYEFIFVLIVLEAGISLIYAEEFKKISY